MTTDHALAVEYRTARAGDREAMEALDGSFHTGTVFEVTRSEAGFALREVPVDPPLHKVFPPAQDDEGDEDDEDEDEDGGEHSRTFVALDAGTLCGFAAVTYAPWNRRLTVEDIEVAPTHRGRGVGRALMELAAGFARERGAAHLWLEVSTVNAPAVHAYRRMGFTLCGLDTALYDGTPAAGEQALFMSRPCG
ncbi:N-acetyltransferase [Streptomyces sp. NBC_00091]|uniref:GNAT family N-acetyltransferase n=1 Tax=Streptomyces sp. NBC_00091 TaxID=2975648 RepID=UPI002257AC5F|nr:GNAT family N-acetyltransferase [Streptomyces sp. NBC_00091]MCX5379824.1 GNAT family N-acetyltransferase [Streptomyces sp. NBC_00091]